jgi:hypothetical protein
MSLPQFTAVRGLIQLVHLPYREYLVVTNRLNRPNRISELLSDRRTATRSTCRDDHRQCPLSKDLLSVLSWLNLS